MSKVRPVRKKDLHGWVRFVAMKFTTAPITTDDSRAFFAKYPQKPDQLPIKYFTRLSPVDLQPVHFFDVHGPELDLYCQNKVVFRKSEWNDSTNSLFRMSRSLRCSTTGSTVRVYRSADDARRRAVHSHSLH